MWVGASAVVGTKAKLARLTNTVPYNKMRLEALKMEALKMVVEKRWKKMRRGDIEGGSW